MQNLCRWYLYPPTHYFCKTKDLNNLNNLNLSKLEAYMVLINKVLRNDGQTIDLPKFSANKAFSEEVVWTTGSINAGATSTINITSFCNKAILKQIIVSASASTDFDIELYEKDAFGAADLIYQNIDNNLYMNDAPITSLDYLDIDSSSELHIKIINTDSSNASTFTIKIKYVKVD